MTLIVKPGFQSNLGNIEVSSQEFLRIVHPAIQTVAMWGYAGRSFELSNERKRIRLALRRQVFQDDVFR